MQVNTYLNFNGQCEEAFKFYEQCLGGKIQGMFTYAGTPAEKHAPPDWGNKILHATMSVGDGVIMGADVISPQYQKPTGFAVTLHMNDPKEAERVFHALAEGGTVTMPIQETFWAVRFGELVDQFGTPWMINCGKPA